MVDFNKEGKRNEGWFAVPHGVFELGLSKNGLLLLITLFKLENAFGGDEGNKMPSYGNIRLRKLAKMSIKSLIKAKRELLDKNLIIINPGYPGKETEYMIIFTDVHRIKCIKSEMELAATRDLRQRKQSQIKRLRRDPKTGKPLRNDDGFYCVLIQVDCELREVWVKFDKDGYLITADGDRV